MSYRGPQNYTEFLGCQI